MTTTRKLTDTQIGALRILEAGPFAAREIRPTGHPVCDPTRKTWDKLRDMGLTELGEIPGCAGRRTVLSAAGRDLLASL